MRMTCSQIHKLHVILTEKEEWDGSATGGARELFLCVAYSPFSLGVDLVVLQEASGAIQAKVMPTMKVDPRFDSLTLQANGTEARILVFKGMKNLGRKRDFRDRVGSSETKG